MDPVAHTLVGGALAGAGLRRRTPLATATLVLAANAPDLDIVTLAAGEYAGLAMRRGWTHGILALLVLPVATAGAVLAWDRHVRRRRDPAAAPAPPRAVLLLALVAVITHPLLDWLNTYGVRLLAPLSMDWSYGDALFIVDPWLWGLLGGALFAGYAYGVRPLAWGVAALAGATALLWFAPVPSGARIAWLVLLTVTLAVRVALPREHAAALARAALSAATLYILAMVAAGLAAESRIRTALEAEGTSGIREVMFQPAPADPFTGSFVARLDDAYRLGTFHWLASPQVRPGRRLEIRRDPALIAAAGSVGRARDFLVWSRFPYFRAVPGPDGTTVLIGDARYVDEPRAGALQGVTVVVRE